MNNYTIVKYLCKYQRFVSTSMKFCEHFAQEIVLPSTLGKTIFVQKVYVGIADMTF